MRLSAGEKYEIIQTIATSEIGVKRTLETLESQEVLSINGIRNTLKTATMAWKRPKEHLKDNGTAFRKNKKIWS